MPGIAPLVAVSLAGFSGYAAMLSVAPLWAVHGGADEAGSGMVNGVLLAATVLSQFRVPTLLRRFGHARVLAAGLLLMGLPAPAYLLGDGLPWVLALSAVRGLGFGILTVTGSAVVAVLVPAHRRGEAIGVYGLAVAVPSLVLLPVSVAIARTWGYGWVFLIAALPLLGIPAAVSLGRHLGDHHPPAEAATTRLGRRTRLAVVRPTLILFAVTMAGGALLTFLPQVIPSAAAAAWSLFLLGVGTAGCRWLVGRLADRHGAERFLAPSLASCAAGLALCAWAIQRGPGHAGPAMLPLFLGVAVVGVSYGALQNLTLVVAFGQVEHAQLPAASAWWNVGFDAGTASGAVLVGSIAAVTSFGAGFWTLAGLTAAALLLCVPGSLGPATPSPA